MSQITVRDLTFAYDGGYDTIFDHASFRIDTDWKLGFIGRNGRGKTTFLKLLMGWLPYRGKISASVCFTYFPFAVEQPQRLAGEVARAIHASYQDWELSRELGLLGLKDSVLARPYQTLSYGERTKLLLAILFLQENAFLLIDEPTNHLDQEGRALVSKYLRGKKGFLLVSHDRTFLDGCVDHILAINKAGIEVQKGNFSSWYANKTIQDEYERAENERLRRDIGRLESAARRTAVWSDRVEKSKHGQRNSGLRPDRGHIGRKSAKMMKRAQSIAARREDAARQKADLLKNVETSPTLKLHPLVYEKKRLAVLEGVSVCYDGQPVSQPVWFEIERGDRIALSGCNGAGKSSLLKRLAGAPLAHTGRIETGAGLVISVVAQDADQLKGNLAAYAQSCGVDRSLFLAILRKLDFPRAQFDKDMAYYSGGQKKKVLLARSLCQRAHLYLWDEPLNFIDVFSRVQIEQLVLEYAPTLVFVEHDAAFAARIATKVQRIIP